jgi:hypothetical protein
VDPCGLFECNADPYVPYEEEEIPEVKKFTVRTLNFLIVWACVAEESKGRIITLTDLVF